MDTNNDKKDGSTSVDKSKNNEGSATVDKAPERQFRTYEHPEFGVVHGAFDDPSNGGLDRAWLRTYDVVRLGATIEDVRFIKHKWTRFTDDDGREYVNACSLMGVFDRKTPDGRYVPGSLDEWLHTVVWYDLLHNGTPTAPEETEIPDPYAVSAELLYQTVGNGCEWQQWYQDLDELETKFSANDSSFSEMAELYDLQGGDFAVPLLVAHLLAETSRTFTGKLVAGVLAEAFTGEVSQAELNDCMDSIVGMIPDWNHHIDARALHRYLQVEEPFLSWISKAIVECGMEVGRDYRCRPGMRRYDHPHWLVWYGVSMVSTQFAVYLARRSPSRRARVLENYRLQAAERLNPDPQPFATMPPKGIFGNRDHDG